VVTADLPWRGGCSWEPWDSTAVADVTAAEARSVTFVWWTASGMSDSLTMQRGRTGQYTVPVFGLPLNVTISYRADAVSVDGVRGSSKLGSVQVNECIIG
jgi:hypothetical protein